MLSVVQWIPNVHYRVNKSSSLYSVLSLLNLVNILTSCFLVKSILILFWHNGWVQKLASNYKPYGCRDRKIIRKMAMKSQQTWRYSVDCRWRERVKPDNCWNVVVVAIHSVLTVSPERNCREGDDVPWDEWLLVVTWNEGGLHSTFSSAPWTVLKAHSET
jgi:hypothetical protein